MKVKYILILLILSCESFGQTCHSEINRIIIKRVSFEIMTAINIPYYDFEKAFFGKIETVNITDNKTINKLKSLSSKLYPINSTMYPYIDTRAEIEFCSTNDTTRIYLDRFILIKNGGVYKAPESLVKFIENKI